MEIHFISRHIFWYLVLTLIAAAVGVISYRVSFPPLGRNRRIFLSTLRALMVVLLGAFLIEPLIDVFSTSVIRPALAVLVDVSKSMGVDDGPGARIARAAGLTGKALGNVKSQRRLFKFSSNIEAVNRVPGSNDPDGDATSIANAFKELSERDDFDNYGAVLLVTDGRQNLGDDPLEAAVKVNVPIYTLTLGRQADEKNLALDNVLYPAIAYSGVDFKVETEISANGLDAGKSRLSVKLGPTTIAEKPFDLPEQGRKVKVSFDIKAPQPGNRQYTISTPILEGEANKADNERLFEVRVLKNKLHIFLGASSLDWEFKFVKQALSSFEEFEVDAVYPQESGRLADPGPPRGLDGLKNYDAIFLVDASPASLRIQTPDLKKYLQDGGSLIYIAGVNSPNDIKFFDGTLPLKPLNPRLVNGEFFFEPSPLKRQHAVVAVDDDPDVGLRLWHSLPPFTSLLTGFEPTGEMLLEAATSSRDSLLPPNKGPAPEARPVLIVGSFGKGRVAAITGFPFWRSYFGAIDNNRVSRVIPDFWRNLLKWSSATEQLQNFRVTTDKKIYRLGEPVRFTAYLYDEANRPKNGAYITLTILSGDANTAIKDVVLPPAAGGIYADEIASLPTGKYKFDASATSYGDTLGKTSGEYVIESFSLEMASNSPDYTLTRRISDATDGKAYNADNFDQFPSQLKLTPITRENQASFRPFGMPLLLVILLCGLCLEWALRKRYRLP